MNNRLNRSLVVASLICLFASCETLEKAMQNGSVKGESHIEIGPDGRLKKLKIDIEFTTGPPSQTRVDIPASNMEVATFKEGSTGKCKPSEGTHSYVIHDGVERIGVSKQLPAFSIGGTSEVLIATIPHSPDEQSGSSSVEHGFATFEVDPFFGDRFQLANLTYELMGDSIDPPVGVVDYGGAKVFLDGSSQVNPWDPIDTELIVADSEEIVGFEYWVNDNLVADHNSPGATLNSGTYGGLGKIQFQLLPGLSWKDEINSEVRYTQADGGEYTVQLRLTFL